MIYDRVRYTLTNKDIPVVVEEPLGWSDDNKTYTRHAEYHGITIALSKDLTFVGGGFLFLTAVLEDQGINADVKLLREVKNTSTDIWEKDYEGWVDFFTYKIEENKITVKFNADPLVTLFKSKQSSNVELDRIETLTTRLIEPLSTETLFITGRNILLTNKVIAPLPAETRLEMDSYGAEVIIPIDMRKVGDKDTGIKDVSDQFNVIDGGRTDVAIGYPDENFFAVNEIGQPYVLDISFRLKMSLYWPSFQVFSTATLGIRIAIYTNGVTMNLDRTIPIYEFTGSRTEMPTELDIQWNQEDVIIDVDESASIQFYLSCTGGNAYWAVGDKAANGGVKDVYIKTHIDPVQGSSSKAYPAYYEVELTVQEDSSRPTSTAPCVLAYEFVKRLSDIVLECEFKSNLLGRFTLGYAEDGPMANTAFTHGMWLRGMEGQDNLKPLATSLKDCLQALDVAYPIGIQLENGLFRLEARDYFYQRYTSIVIGEVTEFMRTPDATAYATSINVGYQKAGGYEETQGLDEYNRETQYNTVINKTDNELDLISPYRADGYGLEEVRRDNPAVEPDEVLDKDSKFDDHIWILDVNKPSGLNQWLISDWTKRFAAAPTGVYSPSTAMNLWFSPINIMLRHGPWIKPMLLKYLDSKVKFNFSEGNSSLRTQLIGGNEYSQDDGIPAIDFERSLHQAINVTFKAPVTWAQLNGNSYGRPNVYGLVEFTYQSIKYKGYIMSVEISNGIGSFKLKLATSTSAKSI